MVTHIIKRVLQFLEELMLINILNALPRQEKVFVKYLNMQQEPH